MMPSSSYSSSYSSSSNDMVGWRHVPALHKQCSEWPRTTYIGCLAGLYRNQLLGNASRISVYTHVYTYVSSSTSSSSALWLTHARRDIQIYMYINRSKYIHHTPIVGMQQLWNRLPCATWRGLGTRSKGTFRAIPPAKHWHQHPSAFNSELIYTHLCIYVYI